MRRTAVYGLAGNAGIVVCPPDHRMTSWQDPLWGGWIFQHGDNPEHRLELGALELAQGEGYAMLRDWVERVHADEAGSVVD